MPPDVRLEDVSSLKQVPCGNGLLAFVAHAHPMHAPQREIRTGAHNTVPTATTAFVYAAGGRAISV